MVDEGAKSGRAAQRRRTRKAIVDAAAELIATGATPSVDEVAKAADMSRRTVYLYFPSVDQLLLDATVGAMNVDIDAELDAITDDDPRVRVEKMIKAITDNSGDSLPLGRKLVKLTVDLPPPSDGMPKRGYRRVGWIEKAIHPLRQELGARRFERLVSALAVVIGWEAFIVLNDVRGLDAAESRRVILTSALALIDAAVAEAAAEPRKAARASKSS